MRTHSRNIVATVSFDALTRLLGFGSTAYLARVLERDGYGIISFGMAVLAYGVVFSTNGLHVIGTRQIAQKDPGPVVFNILSLRLLLSIVALLLIGGGAAIFLTNATERTITILFALSLLAFAMQLEWFFQGKEDLTTVGVGKALSAGIFLVVLLVAVRGFATIAYVPIAYFLGGAASAAFFFARYPRPSAGANPAGSGILTRWRMLLASALPVGLGTIMSQFTTNLPFILLGIFATTGEIGEYGAASKIIFLFLALDRVLYYLFFPLVSRSFRAGTEVFEDRVRRTLRLLPVGLLPLTAVLILGAGWGVGTIYGDGFSGASALVKILALFFFATVLNSAFTYVLIAAGEERAYARVMTVASMALAIVLIPLTWLWHGVGAAAGIACGEAAMSIAMYRMMHARLHIRLGSGLWKPLLCTLAGVAAYCGMCPVGWAASIAAAVLVFALLSWLLRTLTTDDLAFLRERLL